MPEIALPDHAADLARRWGFEPEEELEAGRCSRVFSGGGRILKVPFQGEELLGAAAALRLVDAGGPAVFRADANSGVILMERLQPGTKLWLAGKAPAEEHAVFIRLVQRMQSLDSTGMIPLENYYESRTSLLDRLIATTIDPVFLHGDLHHDNILLGGSEWRPIDPKGLVGDRHFECIAFLRNPLAWVAAVPDLVNETHERVQLLARALDLDPWRIAAWGAADVGPPNDEINDGDPWSRLPGVYAELEARYRRAKGILPP